MSTHIPSRSRYVAGCRCAGCTAQNSAYNCRWSRLSGYDGVASTDLIDAAPVREHVQRLLNAGMGTRAIAAAANVDRKRVTTLLSGRPERGTPPTRRLRPDTAAALMAVTAAPHRVCSDGPRRRIDALGAIGWTRTRLAARLGMTVQNLSWALQRPQVSAATGEAIRALYEELWNSPPTAASRFEQAGITRAIATAREQGHPPPAGWDDDLIDLPEVELAAELSRRVSAMDLKELARCYKAARQHGDRSPLVVEAAVEYSQRKSRRRAA